MDQLLRKVQVMGDEPGLSVAEKTACNVGTKTVQTLQNEHQQGICLVEESKRTISDTVLPLEGRILVMERIDCFQKIEYFCFS